MQYRTDLSRINCLASISAISDSLMYSEDTSVENMAAIDERFFFTEEEGEGLPAIESGSGDSGVGDSAAVVAAAELLCRSDMVFGEVGSRGVGDICEGDICEGDFGEGDPVECLLGGDAVLVTATVDDEVPMGGGDLE